MGIYLNAACRMHLAFIQYCLWSLLQSTILTVPFLCENAFSYQYVVPNLPVLINLTDECEVTRSSTRRSQAESSISFLSLPMEIRNMVYQAYWGLMIDQDNNIDGIKVQRCNNHYARMWDPYTMWVASRHPKPREDLRCRSVFLVCKQVSKEIKDVLWSSKSNFHFYHLDTLRDFLTTKQTTARLRTPLFPGHSIQHIKVRWNWATVSNILNYQYTFRNIQDLETSDPILLDNQVLLLQCLWTVARCTNATMKFEVEYHRNTGISSLHSRLGYDETTDTSTWPDILLQLRQYQALCTKHGVSLRVTKKEMTSWIVDSKTTFAIKLPTIPQDVEAKKLGNTSQVSSSD
jgi:hypothetical protein